MTVAVRRKVAAGVFVLYLVVLVRVTLTPLSKNPFLHGNAVPSRTIVDYLANDQTGMALRNLGGNLALLAPLGLYIGWRWAVVPRSIAAVALTSGTIELIQIALPGRVGDVDDVVLNTIGGGLAVIVGGVVERWAPSSSGRTGDRRTSQLEGVEAAAG